MSLCCWCGWKPSERAARRAGRGDRILPAPRQAWNRPTANTILVFGNTGDPVTPYQNSVAMAHDLGNARLLTINEAGHTEGMNPTTCATNYEVSYLETGALPPAGGVCQADSPPFPG